MRTEVEAARILAGLAARGPHTELAAARALAAGAGLAPVVRIHPERRSWPADRPGRPLRPGPPALRLVVADRG